MSESGSVGPTSQRLCFADISERAKLRFSGPQALWFLDQLVTNKVDELAPQAGAEALLLTPQGRITSHLRILNAGGSEDGREILVDAPAGHAERLLNFFQLRVFATKVSISDASGEYAIIRLLGKEAHQVAGEALGLERPGSEEHKCREFSIEAISGIAVQVAMPSPGLDLWVPAVYRSQIAELLTDLGAEALPEPAYEAMRVAAGVPVYGIDFDDGYLPQEAALERAVHFAKGCYLGQEAVAMAQRGRIKRRVRRLRFRGPGLTGEVVQGGKQAGRVSSAASVDDEWFGIGTIKTDVGVGERVKVVAEEPRGQADDRAGVEAVTEELPGTTYGPRVPSARELREKLQGG